MMLLSRLSIRWRITLGSLVIATVFFGLAGFAFRAEVVSILSSTTETLLKHDAAPIVTEISNGAATIDTPGRGQLVSVVGPDGIVKRSTLPDDLRSRLDEILRFSGESREFVAGDDTYLVLIQSVNSSGGAWSVVTARNLDASTLLLGSITTAMVIGALILIVGFGIASWLMTGAALRPVSRMRAQAETLSKGGTSEPLQVGPARDELAALAETLNEFIENQRTTAARERQMVSDASHELRSPIAVLMAQLELAHLNSGDAVALEAEISTAQASTRRIADLATSLLELSALESTSSTSFSSWDELSRELGEAADRARSMGAGSGVDVNFEIESDGDRGAARYPLPVSRFGRIVDNLSGNALAVQPNGGELQLTLVQRPWELELRVEDGGPGMPDEFIPHAFDRFTRPDESRNAATGGSGLGLAIVRAIVNQAGGTVGLANSHPGLVARVLIPEVEIQGELSET